MLSIVLIIPSPTHPSIVHILFRSWVGIYGNYSVVLQRNQIMLLTDLRRSYADSLPFCDAGILGVYNQSILPTILSQPLAKYMPATVVMFLHRSFDCSCYSSSLVRHVNHVCLLFPILAGYCINHY